LDVASRLLQQLHGTTSREWNVADGMTGQRRVWYKFTDRWIRSERHYYQALNYTHYNPLNDHRLKPVGLQATESGSSG
jgi:putative transposase